MTFSLRRGADRASKSFHTCTPSSFLGFIGLSLGGIEFQRMGQDSCLSGWNQVESLRYFRVETAPPARRAQRCCAATRDRKSEDGLKAALQRSKPGGSPQ